MAQNWKMVPCEHCGQNFGRLARLKVHKLEEHGVGVERRKLTLGETNEATACSNWQEFTVMLRGLPTDRKLFYLDLYLRCYRGAWYLDGEYCCTNRVQQVQVLYYLNTMSKAGLVERLHDLTTMDLFKYWDRIKVRK